MQCGICSTQMCDDNSRSSLVSFHILCNETKKCLLNSVLSIHNFLLRHYDHVTNSDFVPYQVLQTPRNNKSA